MRNGSALTRHSEHAERSSFTFAHLVRTRIELDRDIGQPVLQSGARIQEDIRMKELPINQCIANATQRKAAQRKYLPAEKSVAY